MKTEYDREIDCKYVSFKKGRVAKTLPVKDWLNFDLDEKENVIGIEILEASRHNVGISTIGGDFVWCIDMERPEPDSGKDYHQSRLDAPKKITPQYEVVVT